MELEKTNVPHIKSFMEIPGISAITLQRLSARSTPLRALQKILNDTNKHAALTKNRKNSKTNEERFSITSDELQAYLVLCVVTSQVKNSKIDIYCSKRVFVETSIYPKTMPPKRFLAISNFFHFANNDTFFVPYKFHVLRLLEG